MSAELDALRIYQQIFFASPDYIAFSRVTTNGSVANGSYIDVNPGFERLTGYTREEAIGKSAPELNLWVCADERKAFLEILQAKREVHGFRARTRVRSGEIRHVEASASISMFDGEPVIVGIIRDITDRKRDEDELNLYRNQLEQLVEQRTMELQRANQELRETNAKLAEMHNQLLQAEKMASIGQLAAGVAHEINNPLGFVISNMNSLKRYVQDLLDVIQTYEQHEDAHAQRPEVMQELQAMKSRVDLEFLKEDVGTLLAESADGMLRVKKIVQDLKDFSHVGSTEWQLASLHAGIDSTLNIVNNEIRYKAKVIKEYGTLPDIECLPLELNQVFMNMLVNGAHAIENEGEIRIRTGVEGDSAWVEFRDNGSGIPPEILNRIFDPFFTTKPVGKGTGLGLSLSYSIVQKHHGAIEVESTPGQGTCFRIRLPLRQARKSE